MGLFNGFLRGLGFEGEKKVKSQKNIEKEETPSAYTNAGAKFDLASQYQEIIPNNQQEVQNAVDILKNGETIIINLKQIKDGEYIRALDFLSGAIYVLNGKIKKINDKTFLFCVKD